MYLILDSLGLAVFVCFILVVAITIACCRSKKSSRRLGAKRPFDYDGYAEFDEQAGLEPDTVKAYNIDGGMAILTWDHCNFVSSLSFLLDFFGFPLQISYFELLWQVLHSLPN